MSLSEVRLIIGQALQLGRAELGEDPKLIAEYDRHVYAKSWEELDLDEPAAIGYAELWSIRALSSEPVRGFENGNCSVPFHAVIVQPSAVESCHGPPAV